jgi:hypothetical protein
MQQRRLRLGDILDDYCPRERRITNHAVVAMIEDDVRQTRCTTCDTEHEYKQGRLPALRRKKEPVSKAYNEVLAAVTTDAAMLAAQAASRAGTADAEGRQAPVSTEDAPSTPSVDGLEASAPPEPSGQAETGAPAEAAAGTADGAQDGPDDSAGRVHRRLIRATLPRPENQPTQRPVPEFTMRQPQGRGGKFRSARGPAGRGMAAGRPGGHGNGNSRGGGFGRAGARNDFNRSPRGGQHPPRRDKKHSK